MPLSRLSVIINGPHSVLDHFLYNNHYYLHFTHMVGWNINYCPCLTSTLSEKLSPFVWYKSACQLKYILFVILYIILYKLPSRNNPPPPHTHTCTNTPFPLFRCSKLFKCSNITAKTWEKKILHYQQFGTIKSSPSTRQIWIKLSFHIKK